VAAACKSKSLALCSKIDTSYRLYKTALRQAFYILSALEDQEWMRPGVFCWE